MRRKLANATCRDLKLVAAFSVVMRLPSYRLVCARSIATLISRVAAWTRVRCRRCPSKRQSTGLRWKTGRVFKRCVSGILSIYITSNYHLPRSRIVDLLNLHRWNRAFASAHLSHAAGNSADWRARLTASAAVTAAAASWCACASCFHRAGSAGCAVSFVNSNYLIKQDTEERQTAYRIWLTAATLPEYGYTERST